MDRTQYIFHSENGKNLSSQDREKLGIILKSFDENTPLPVDEENGEIVFEGLVAAQRPASIASPTTTNIPRTQFAPQPSFAKATAGKQESFIKPYNPTPEPPRQAPRPAPMPIQVIPTQNFTRPNIADQPQPLAQTPPLAKIPYKATTSDPELNKYFNTPDSSEIPSIKIHSMTEHNEPKAAPQVAPRPIVQPLLPPRQASPPPQPERPKYRVINPFEQRIAEPRIDGNIVDLSANNDQ